MNNETVRAGEQELPVDSPAESMTNKEKDKTGKQGPDSVQTGAVRGL